jgi:ParB-like chromosome segregation protein Spo0J
MGTIGLEEFGILKEIDGIVEKIDELGDKQKIKVLNEIKRKIHEISPMKNQPTDCVLWIENDKIEANDYNPNKVAPPEMKLLEHSIEMDGYTQPIVTWQRDNVYEVVDGFHRNLIGRHDKISKRINGYLPVTVIKGDREGRNDRIAATIRHNRARGKHTIDGMSEIIMELTKRKWSDKRIARELGMEPDEVLRLKQITGLAEMFADKEFSEAWEIR